jgi:hypothetical protein
MLPNGNPGGYLATPPLLLTTIPSLAMLHGGLFFTANPVTSRAPISSIRVRVRGVSGPDALSRERLRLAAQRIVHRTGLQVDVTAGASATRVRVALPPGRFGRPALTLEEAWVRKGVAPALLRAIDRKSVVLFALTLVVCALFAANAAMAAVRQRRTELGVLAALGWPARRLFALVLIEVGAVGLGAGLAGTLLALPAGWALGIELSPAHAALAAPAATLLALLAGLWPATRAARAEPAATLRPPVLAARGAHAPRGIGGLALVNLARVPGRSALAALAMAVGACALTLVLAVALSFHGAVVGTVLGDAVAVQVRTADVLAVVATLLLGALAVADVLFLNVRDRAGELAALRATGWRDDQLARLVAWEGLAIGLLGGLAGALAGLGATRAFTGEWSALGGAGAALLAAALAGALASLVPAAVVRRLPTARLLAEE